VVEEEKLINSGEATDLTVSEGRDFILNRIGKQGANHATVYRLRDWLISRQRYWGVPIPVVF
jgi:leucyl-tRNA synthetase